MELKPCSPESSRIQNLAEPNQELWKTRLGVIFKDIRGSFDIKKAKNARIKTIPPLRKTMYSIPWWLLSVGIHVAALLLLTIITVSHISLPDDRTVIVTINEHQPQIDLSKCVLEDIYDPPAIPQNIFSQTSEKSFLLYPGFLPKETTIKNDSPRTEDNQTDALAFLPSGKSGIRGKIPGKTGSIGVGQRGSHGSGLNNSSSAMNNSDGPERNLAASNSNPIPSYPPLARQLGQEGRVIIQVEVNENGSVLMASIIKSSGFKLLDESALKAVKTWAFIPATKNHKPVPGTMRIPISFKLT